MNIVILEVHLDIPFDNASFHISAIVHPHTYLNEILFGSRQGSMKLWNIHRNELIYTFTGWDSTVSVLEQVSPYCYYYY